MLVELVHLIHDVAFALDLSELEEGPLGEPEIPTFAEVIRLARYCIRKTFGRRPPAGPTLNCFREDAERTFWPLKEENFDLTGYLDGGVSPKYVARIVSREVVRILRGYDTINTNRLHVSIIGARLGKTVNFYNNSYGKNRAVFQMSLEAYPNISWMG